MVVKAACQLQLLRWQIKQVECRQCTHAFSNLALLIYLVLIIHLI